MSNEGGDQSRRPPAPSNRGDGYIVEITIHSGSSLPIADINTLSADPYVLATIYPSDQSLPVLQQYYKDDLPLSCRTPTVRRTRNPEWNCSWRVAGLPQSGFRLSLKVVDEDPGDRDDRMGIADVYILKDQMHVGYELKEHNAVVQKRKGSVVPYMLTYIAGIFPGQKIVLHPRVLVSIKVVGKCDKTDREMGYTVGPNKYTQHFSPLIGKMIGKDSVGRGEDGPKKLAPSTFLANKLQLTGPVPPELRHRFVAYRPFINWLFKKSGLFGRILNLGMHKQYRTVYSYDKNTIYGVVEASSEPDASEEKRSSLSEAMAHRFLEMTNFGEDDRLFTYVITLDGEWRFCETGEEFAIDLLSKHAMHANLAKEVAFSGEFFVRPMPQEEDQRAQRVIPENGDNEWSNAKQSGNPKSYSLVIDNDSGTYRPKKERLPVFQSWLAKEGNLDGLGEVLAMDGFDEKLKGWKTSRKEAKKKGAKDHGKAGHSDPGASAVSGSQSGHRPDTSEAGAGGSHTGPTNTRPGSGSEEAAGKTDPHIGNGVSVS